MSTIQILEDELINKIAAGEVVERPGSVVKELIENSLDAGALSIKIELQQGGKESIIVSDNGSGMSPSDALMAIKRHATSKIKTLEDLTMVESMGFRGEALASIAAVSRFCLQGSDGAEGYRISSPNLGTYDAWDGPQGTRIVVEDLFCAVPARKKFLKSSQAEYGYCLEIVQAIALARTDVSISLKHNGKQTCEFNAVDSKGDSSNCEKVLRDRANQILGESIAERLLFVSGESQFGSIYGLISPPTLTRSNSKSNYTFVNKRWVKDKVLRMGIQRGYHTHLLSGKHPLSLLYLETDPTLVDFNAHPAKTEVRFQYGREVQDLFAQSIRKTIRKGEWFESSITPTVAEFSQQAEANDLGFKSSSTSTWGSAKGSMKAPLKSSLWTSGDLDLHYAGSSARSESPQKFSYPEDVKTETFVKRAVVSEGRHSTQNKKIPWQDLGYIGQFGNCYLFFEWNQQLLAVDQHAFHERILFERLKTKESEFCRSQKLLVTEAIDLSPTDIALIAEQEEFLQSIGFRTNILLPLTVEITAVPSILTGKDLDSFFKELLETLKTTIGRDQWLDHVLASVACHSAVRSGEKLDQSDLKALLDEAMSVDFYHNCPHGRPVFKWWNKDQVGRWFDR